LVLEEMAQLAVVDMVGLEAGLGVSLNGLAPLCLFLMFCKYKLDEVAAHQLQQAQVLSGINKKTELATFF